MQTKKNESVGTFYGVAIITALFFSLAALFFGVFVEHALLKNIGVVNFRQAIPMYIIFTLFFMQLTGAFQVGKKRLFDVAYALFMTTIFVNLSMLALPLLDIMYDLSILSIAITAFSQLILFAVWAYVFHRLYFIIFPKRPAVVISDSMEHAAYCAEKVRIYSREFQIVGTAESLEYLKQLLDICDTVIAYNLDARLLSQLVELCITNSHQLCVVPELLELSMQKSREFQFGDMMAFRINMLKLSKNEEIVKRIFDIFVSLCGIIISFLPVLIFAMIIFIQDKHSPFYCQERLTKGGKEFKVIKLRTMIPDAEKNTGPVLASVTDSRITPVGLFLRQTRLDELPQFLNVFCGQMSIVGPRPERRYFTELYEQKVPGFSRRLAVKAGITGMAHVFGRYDTPPEERVKLDYYYILNYSVLLDIKIVIETLRIMFSPTYAEGVKGKK